MFTPTSEAAFGNIRHIAALTLEQMCHLSYLNRVSVTACLFLCFFFKVCFICSFLDTQPLTPSGGYVYPDWAYRLGWAIALSSVVPVPIWAVVKMCLTEGTFRQVRAPKHPAKYFYSDLLFKYFILPSVIKKKKKKTLYEIVYHSFL